MGEVLLARRKFLGLHELGGVFLDAELIGYGKAKYARRRCANLPASLGTEAAAALRFWKTPTCHGLPEGLSAYRVGSSVLKTKLEVCNMALPLK